MDYKVAKNIWSEALHISCIRCEELGQCQRSLSSYRFVAPQQRCERASDSSDVKMPATAAITNYLGNIQKTSHSGAPGLFREHYAHARDK